MLLKAVPGTESIFPVTPARAFVAEQPSASIRAPSNRPHRQQSRRTPAIPSESVIHVFNTPLTWTLTLVLVAGGIHYAMKAIRSRRTTERINNSLHALMHTLMAAMLWDAAASITLAQIAVLAAAALWFIIQAVARPQFRSFCAGSRDRLKCLYHSLTMAAAALMIAMMAIPALAPPAPPGSAMTGSGMPGSGMPGSGMAGSGMSSHGHHASTAALGPATASVHTAALAIAFTVIFGSAAVIFLVLLARRHRRPAHQTPGHVQATGHVQTAAHVQTTGHAQTPGHAQATGHAARLDHVLEAAGAIVMALMFATLAV